MCVQYVCAWVHSVLSQDSLMLLKYGSPEVHLPACVVLLSVGCYLSMYCFVVRARDLRFGFPVILWALICTIDHVLCFMSLSPFCRRFCILRRNAYRHTRCCLLSAFCLLVVLLVMNCYACLQSRSFVDVCRFWPVTVVITAVCVLL